jgi:hypothetical protein
VKDFSSTLTQSRRLCLRRRLQPGRGQSIQMQRGFAFTAEHFAHLYLRRARADARLLGPSRLYRDKYPTALEVAA